MADSDKQNAGAGADGSQNANSGDTGDTNAGGENKGSDRALTLKDVDAITQNVVEQLKGQFVSAADLTALKTGISNEITGAVKKASSKKSGADNKADDKGGGDSGTALLNQSVELPGGESVTVADLVKNQMEYAQQQQEWKAQESARKQRETLVAIREGLQKRGFLAGNIGLVADGLATKITEIDGKLVAEKVSVPNPLKSGETFERNLSIDDYLDHVAQENPQLVGDTTKPGTNSGGGKDQTAGGKNPTAQQLMTGTVEMVDWMEKNPDKAKEILNGEVANALQNPISAFSSK